jgi:hypothetical protein
MDLTSSSSRKKYSLNESAEIFKPRGALEEENRKDTLSSLVQHRIRTTMKQMSPRSLYVGTQLKRLDQMDETTANRL